MTQLIDRFEVIKQQGDGIHASMKSWYGDLLQYQKALEVPIGETEQAITDNEKGFIEEHLQRVEQEMEFFSGLFDSQQKTLKRLHDIQSGRLLVGPKTLPTQEELERQRERNVMYMPRITRATINEDYLQ